MMEKLVRRLLVLAIVAMLAVLAIRTARPHLEWAGVAAGRRGRHLRGRARGWAYHLRRRHPALDVDDSLLADRIRSTIGPVVKRVGAPHPDIAVEGHVATIAGTVPTAEAAHDIERAVGHVTGVIAVRSHLHVTA